MLAVALECPLGKCEKPPACPNFFRLWHSNGELVFGIKTSVKNAFNKVKTKAGLADLRFHDVRHTNATRLVGGSMPLSEVGRMLGHTQPSTSYRYVNVNADTARRHLAPAWRTESLHPI